MQTHEWETLLAGTTEGPWRWELVDADAGRYKINNPDGKHILEDGSRLHPTLDLMAAAPEAVAEVVRLRREIAAMRDRYLARIAAAADYITADLMEAQSTADALTRILEGDTDE